MKYYAMAIIISASGAVIRGLAPIILALPIIDCPEQGNENLNE